jgi:hypothetical protein
MSISESQVDAARLMAIYVSVGRGDADVPCKLADPLRLPLRRGVILSTLI